MKNTKKDCQKFEKLMKPFLRVRKRQLYRHILGLPNVKLTFCLTICSCLLFGFSHTFYRLGWEWLSNAFLSIGTGGITGIVFYMLANVRANKEDYTRDSYCLLRNLFSLIQEIILSPFSLKQIVSLNAFEVGEKVMGWLSEIEEMEKSISISLYQELKWDVDDPFDLDKMKIYRENYINAQANKTEMHQWIEGVANDLQPVGDKVQTLLIKKKDELTFLKKISF